MFSPPSTFFLVYLPKHIGLDKSQTGNGRLLLNFQRTDWREDDAVWISTICKIKSTKFVLFPLWFQFVWPAWPHIVHIMNISENFCKNTLNVSRAHHFLIYFSFSSNLFLSSYFTLQVLCFLFHVDKGSLWISISFTFLPFPRVPFSSLVLWLLLGAKVII